MIEPPRPNVITVADGADRDFRTALDRPDLELELVALWRFAAVRDRDRIVLALSGPPTAADLEQLGDRAAAIADQMRLVANALDPPAPGRGQRIVIDFADDADAAAITMLAREVADWTAGRALPYGAQPPRVLPRRHALELDPLGPIA
jgi:hypothetical protein